VSNFSDCHTNFHHSSAATIATAVEAAAQSMSGDHADSATHNCWRAPPPSAAPQAPWGLNYLSTRNDGGECIAAFRTRAVSLPAQSKHFCYRWDGTRVDRVITVSAVREPG